MFALLGQLLTCFWKKSKASFPQVIGDKPEIDVFIILAINETKMFSL